MQESGCSTNKRIIIAISYQTNRVIKDYSWVYCDYIFKKETGVGNIKTFKTESLP